MAQTTIQTVVIVDHRDPMVVRRGDDQQLEQQLAKIDKQIDKQMDQFDRKFENCMDGCDKWCGKCSSGIDKCCSRHPRCCNCFAKCLDATCNKLTLGILLWLGVIGVCSFYSYKFFEASWNVVGSKIEWQQSSCLVHASSVYLAYMSCGKDCTKPHYTREFHVTLDAINATVERACWDYDTSTRRCKIEIAVLSKLSSLFCC
eukprot:SAG31_NODE_252_length_19068_cov_18.307713_10_plen_202_part_00